MIQLLELEFQGTRVVAKWQAVGCSRDVQPIERNSNRYRQSPNQERALAQELKLDEHGSQFCLSRLFA